MLRCQHFHNTACKSCKLLTVRAINHSSSAASAAFSRLHYGQINHVFLYVITRVDSHLMTFEPWQTHGPWQPWNAWFST